MSHSYDILSKIDASMKDIDDNYEAYRYAFVFIIPFDFV